MNEHSPQVRRVLARLGAVVFAWGAAAPAQALEPDVTVTVLHDQFVAGSRGFHSLHTLEMHLEAVQPQAVRVQACGPSSIRAWKALVYRLRHLPLELVGGDPGGRACAAPPPVALPAGSRAGRPEADMEDARADRYWRELLP